MPVLVQGGSAEMAGQVSATTPATEHDAADFDPRTTSAGSISTIATCWELSQSAKHHANHFLQPCGWNCSGWMPSLPKPVCWAVRDWRQRNRWRSSLPEHRSRLKRWSSSAAVFITGCNDPQEQKALKARRDSCTRQLAQLRKDRKMPGRFWTGPRSDAFI